MAHLYNRVVSLIAKPKEQRGDEDINALLPWFSKKSALFEKVKSPVLIDILRNCGYATYDVNDPIIKQNERGEEFFIILSGNVSVYVNTDWVPDDPADARPPDLALPLDRKKLGNFIVQLGEGKTFGELALITKDSIRNASVVADEPTDLIVVRRDLFDRSIRAPQELDLRMRDTFVRQHPLFRGWAPRYRRQAMMSLRREPLQFGMVVVKQGDPVNGLVMIHIGQAKFTVDTIMHQSQYPELCPDPNSRPSSRLFNNGVPNSRVSYALAENRLQRRNVELCLVGENEIIGDVEQCVGLETYMQTVTCVQPCELMILDDKNFERLVAKRNQQACRLLRQNAEAKLRRRQESTVPLIGALIQHLERQDKVSRLRKAGADFRDPLEIVRQPVSYSVKELHNVLNFLPPRGALVDLYGPGTLFYRNRTLRKIHQTEQQRAQARLRLKSEGPSVNQRLQASALLPQHPAGPPSAASNHDGRHGNSCSFCASVSRLTRGSATSRASTARSFKDWETSNEHLSELETRMQEWLVYLGERDVQRQRFAPQIQLPTVTQLRTETVSVPVRPVSSNLPVRLQRFKPPSRHAVRPGIKVVLRRRSADRVRSSDVEAPPPLVRAKTAVTSYTVLSDAKMRWDSAKRTASSPFNDSDAESVTSSTHSPASPKSKKRHPKKKTVSVREYNELKDRMKRQEAELALFRAKTALV